MIELRLPWPPSVNSYWRSPNKGPLAGRTLISEKGRKYRLDVHAAIMEQIGLKRVQGRLSVKIVAHVPDARRRDLDNIPKAIFDSVTNARTWQDDSDIDEIHIVRAPKIKDGLIILTITEIT